MSRRPLPLYQSLSLPHASLSLLAAALLAACSSGEQAEAPKTAPNVGTWPYKSDARRPAQGASTSAAVAGSYL